MANSVEDANAKNMEVLAKANRASIASLYSTLSIYGQRITDGEDGLKECDKRLSSVELSQALLAKENGVLRITPESRIFALWG